MKYLAVVVSLFWGIHGLSAQEKIKAWLQGEVDSSYYDALDDHLTLKLFTAQKYSEFALNDNVYDMHLDYRANPTRSYGVGMSYKWLGFNIGYGFSAANQDDEKYGETHRIDLQTAILLRKLSLTLFASHYQGYYLENSSSVFDDWDPSLYYKRGDIRDLTFGISANYMFNYKHFSNRAIFLQNEWQKRTAGTFVLGGSIYYRQTRSDSSLIPTNMPIPDFYDGVDFNAIRYVAAGAEGGYLFNFVVHQNWFINFGLMVGLSSGYNALQKTSGSLLEAYNLNATVITNGAMGYNNKQFYIGFGYQRYIAGAQSPIEDMGMSYVSGKGHIVVAYRFKVKKFIQLPAWSPLQF